MSTDDKDLEQITKVPEELKNEPKKKDKDPKKVAAGKKLAEYNRKAKEAMEREMKREANEKSDEDDNGWIPEISFSTVISLVGVGLTVLNMFWLNYKNRIVDLSAVSTEVPDSPKEPQYQEPSKNQPRIGMA